jgi:hypothetical protein
MRLSSYRQRKAGGFYFFVLSFSKKYFPIVSDVFRLFPSHCAWVMAAVKSD